MSMPSSDKGRRPSGARRIALSAMLASLALVFSYLEAILPWQSPVPGVKLGLANLVVLVALYRMDAGYALAAGLVRVLLAGLLFSGLTGMIYSLAGSLLSFAVMLALKRTGLFSVLGVSLAGGVSHNMGQLLAAILTVSSPSLIAYAPVLIGSGMAAGILVGLGAFVLIGRLPARLFDQEAG